MIKSFWHCPICGSKYLVDKRYKNLVHIYNVLSKSLNGKEAKNVCENCGYIEIKNLKKYSILKISDHSNVPKTDPDSVKRIGKTGYFYKLVVGHSAVFVYEGENSKSLVTSKVTEISRDYKESYFIVKTNNSIYTFVECV